MMISLSKFLRSISISSETKSLVKLIPISSLETERWDREWITYFNTEDPRPFLLDYTSINPDQIIIKNLSNLSELEILETCLFATLPALNIWASGTDLVNKQVLEIGCGPGFLGKQLGFVAKQYLGIDYSKLALSIARLVSPQNCDYVHLSDFDSICKYTDTIDTMVGRFFFIHQNFDNAIWLLRLAHLLLKPGGIIRADFYQSNPEIKQGVVFTSKHALSNQYPSCAFEYTESEIQELAEIAKLKVTSMTKYPSMQRLFVRFEK